MKMIKTALASAVFAFVGGMANAATITFYIDAGTNSGAKFTITCTLACEGVGGDDGTEGQLYSLKDYPQLGNANTQYEAGVEAETGFDVSYVDGSEKTYTEVGTLMSSADYVTFKTGGGQEFDLGIIKNTSGMANTYVFAKVPGAQRAGLSNTREFNCVDNPNNAGCEGGGGGGGGGGEVPLPGGLPLMAGGLALGAYVMRKRKTA